MNFFQLYRKDIFFIVGICLLYVLIIVVISPKVATLGTDGVSYALMAQSLTEGKGLTVFGEPHVFFSPLFSFFIVPFFFFIGDIYLAARVAMITLSLLSLPLFYYLMRLMAGKTQAVIGTIFLLFNAGWIMMTNNVLAQPLAGFLALALLVALIKFLRVKDAKLSKAFIHYFVIGFLLGAAYLTRPEYLFSVIPVVLFMWFINKRRLSFEENVRAIIVPIIVFSLLVVPYILFLHKYTGQWTFSGRLNEQFLVSAQLSREDTSLLHPTSLGTNPLSLFFKNISSFVKVYFKNIFGIERVLLRSFGIIGFVFFGFGLASFVFSRKFGLLFSVGVMMFSLLFLALGHTGERGYIGPFLFLFIIIISVGCHYAIIKLSDFFQFNKKKRALLLSAVVTISALYFFFSVIQSYLFLPKSFKPAEYQMTGEWFRFNVDDFDRELIVARNPEIAFYSKSRWYEISGAERLDDLVEKMKKNSANYLVLDQRGLGENFYRLMGNNNPSALHPHLDLLKEFRYYDKVVYLYRLN